MTIQKSAYKSLYSNVNAHIAIDVIQRVSKSSIASYIKEFGVENLSEVAPFTVCDNDDSFENRHAPTRLPDPLFQYIESEDGVLAYIG